jgi:hypothetical protein
MAKIIRLTPWLGHIVISIPLVPHGREDVDPWTASFLDTSRKTYLHHMWTDHHWGEGISKI